MTRAVVLISGRGSNLEALLTTRPLVDFAAVICNRPEAPGLQLAARHGIPTRVVDHKSFPSRDAFDAALGDCIAEFQPDLVIQAGFMRILGAQLVARYSRRMLNIHPSLLPSFPGLHTHEKVINAGVRIHGCTVHFVTPELDAGPIVIQAAVSVLPDDTPSTLAARVLAEENRIYPQAVRWFAEGRIEFMEGDVVKVRGADVKPASLTSPQLP